ncbi:hypothetical protein GCM10028798_29940 [Humibacter antri]
MLRRRWLLSIGSVLTVLVLASAGFVVSEYWNVSTGIHRSVIHLPKAAQVPGVAQNSAATNILVMGLDSRLDEDGNALPADVYNALHAGNQDDGGYNTNVLMLIHIPAGSGKAVGISIPRDDWVPLPGRPDGTSMGKIKEAYGLQLDDTLRHLVNTQPNLSRADAYQQARTAARQEEITTVSTFLGNVPINHFIEVTMAAFYRLAVAVQPIQVCLNEATSDTYSGADFVKGYQNLSASQAVSFVRQRRDTSDSTVNLTDLDRERRQQAFIVSLSYKLRHENVFTNFPLMQTLIDTAKQYIALDSDFDLLGFASDANRFAAGGITFTTLPITGFGVEDGKDVNLVDTAQVDSITAQLIAQSDASSTPSPTPKPSSGRTGHHSRSGSTSHTTAPAAPSVSPTPTPTSNVYTDPNQPMSSGAIPCVN